MKKILREFIFFLAINLVALGNVFSQEFALVDIKAPCEKEKGVWREFGDDCADYCYAQVDRERICTKSALTYGCDCGKTRCWDEEQEACVSTKKYKIEYDKKEEERKKAEAEEEAKSKITSTLGNLKNSIAGVGNSNDKPESAPTPLPPDPNQDYLNYLSQTCKTQNGIWRDFGKSCSGTCESKAADKSQVVVCNALISFSCDCGDNKCWYQNQCIEVSKYKENKAKENPDATKDDKANSDNKDNKANNDKNNTPPSNSATPSNNTTPNKATPSSINIPTVNPANTITSPKTSNSGTSPTPTIPAPTTPSTSNFNSSSSGSSWVSSPSTTPTNNSTNNSNYNLNNNKFYSNVPFTDPFATSTPTTQNN